MPSAIFIFFLLLTSSPAAASASVDLSLAEARKASSGSSYEALAAKSTALIEAGDASGLAAYLASVKGDPALETPVRERLLHETLMGMQDVMPDTAARVEVGRLCAYMSVTRVASAEHGHREDHLLYDVGAAARFTEVRWEENVARKAARTAIGRTDPALLDRYVTGSAATRRGIEQAVAESPPETLAGYGGPLAVGLKGGQPVARLAEVMATRTTDATLMLAVLQEAPPQVAVHALTRMRFGDWPGQMLPLLAAATMRAETASAAMLQLGMLTDREPQARTLLLDALGTTRGSGAAAALARTGADDMIDELAGLLDSADSDLTRRQALLGLRLADTPRARTHLATFAARPDAPAHLVEEVPAWLRRD